jgi:hypothetical protein
MGEVMGEGLSTRRLSSESESESESITMNWEWNANFGEIGSGVISTTSSFSSLSSSSSGTAKLFVDNDRGAFVDSGIELQLG